MINSLGFLTLVCVRSCWSLWYANTWMRRGSNFANSVDEKIAHNYNNTQKPFILLYISYYLTDWPGGMRIISPATNRIIFISCRNLLKAALTFARICYFHKNTRACTVSYKTGRSGVQPIHSPQSFFVWFLHFSDYEADYPFSGHHSFLRHFRPKVGTSFVKYVTFQIKSGFPFSLMTD